MRHKTQEPMVATDEELVSAFRGGDLSAFDTLVKRWEKKIQGAVFRIMGSGEDARDLAQETFLRAYRGLPTFKSEARFSSWLYQIALNLCRDRLRQRRGKIMLSIEDLDPATAARIDRSAASAQELVEARDTSRLVSGAMATLPEEQREVIVLKEYQGLTFQEIADTLDVPVSTVKTRLYRGLVQMREHLERQGMRREAPVPAPLA
jgi:RNA polymerase sigma-70 factor (ECF subfamily)